MTTRRRIPPGVEFAAIVGTIVLGFALNLAGVFWNAPKVANSSLLIFALPVAWLFGAGLHHLVHKRWLAGIVRLLSLPAALLGGLASIVGAQLLGFAMVSGDLLPAKSPLPEKLTAPFIREGRDLAAASTAPDGTPLVLDGLDFTEEAGRREVTFQLRSREAASLRLNPRYTLRDGAWTLAGSGGSANTQAELKAAGERNVFPKTLAPPAPQWPVPEELSARLTQAAGQLAEALGNFRFGKPDGTNWQIARISFHLPEEGRPSVSLVFSNASQRDLVWTRWRWDGKALHLTDVTAEGSRERSAAALTVIEKALPAADFLRPRPQQESDWRRVATKLPDGTELAYIERPAHAFLAEYHMRVGITPRGGKEEFFELPMNTGGRTAVFVYTGATKDGIPAVRLVASRHFDAVFTTQTPDWRESEDFIETGFAGGFLGVHTPLGWFPAGDPEIEKVRSLPNY